MKKSQKKNQKIGNKFAVRSNTDLGDLGLEPPKIYRDSQKQQSRPAKKQELTRQEKRQKDNKKRKKRNTARRALVWILLMVTLIAVGVVLSLTVFFNITEITISGSEKYSEDEILSHCTIDMGENLFLADTKAVKYRLEQNLPYIYNAQIKRKIPYTIEITITDAQPAYSISNKDKTYILLDNNFKVLETNAPKGDGISIFKAEILKADAGMPIQFKNEDIGTCLKKLAIAVKENNFDMITAVYSNNISDNYVVYDGRIDFKLGTCDNLENKIYQGLASCKKLDESNPNAKGTMNITGDKHIYFTEK